MPYQEITNVLLELCYKANGLLFVLQQNNEKVHKNAMDRINPIVHTSSSRVEIEKNSDTIVQEWHKKCVDTLTDNGLFLEREEFLSYSGNRDVFDNFNLKIGGLVSYLMSRKTLLLKIAREIENNKRGKEVILLKVEQIDNFHNLSSIPASDVQKYSKSVFLEEDVENAFLEALGEPYKELDSGAETRDLSSDRLFVKGHRLSTAMMLKGRGLKGTLRLNNCGDKGSQLLKLAKNNSAECFIVQHVDKIDPEVRETLIDLVKMNSRFNRIYICFIDGVDTARILKSMNKDLEKLKNKR